MLSVPVGVLLLLVVDAAATGQQPLNNNNTETHYYSVGGHILSWANRSSEQPSNHLILEGGGAEDAEDFDNGGQPERSKGVRGGERVTLINIVRNRSIEWLTSHT